MSERRFAVLAWGFASVVWALNADARSKFLGFGPAWIDWIVLAVNLLFFVAVVLAGPNANQGRP